MTSLRRFIVVLLVALALPLQALAAAAMLHCVDAGAGVPTGPEHGQHAHGDHGHAAPAATELPGDAPFASIDPATAHACSACAACCTMAAFPAVALPVPQGERVPAVVLDAPQPAAVFLTSGVERPPRRAA